MTFGPDSFLQHGILGGFVLVLIVSISATFRLINRLIDTLHENSKEQVGALLSVERAVKESIDKAEHRHTDTISTFLKSANLIVETREALKRWTSHCRTHCGFPVNGTAEKDPDHDHNELS